MGYNFVIAIVYLKLNSIVNILNVNIYVFLTKKQNSHCIPVRNWHWVWDALEF